MQFRNFLSQVIHTLENPDIPLINILFIGFFSTIFRFFFESFSQHSWNYFNLPSDLFFKAMLQGTLLYFLISILFTIIFHYATHEHVEKIFRVVVTSMLFLILAPLIDFSLSAGSGFNMSYFVPG